MPRHGDLLVEVVTNGPFAENCFVVADAGSRKGVVIDPGDEEERILEVVRGQKIEVQEIVCTHAHIDHAGAVAPLKRLLGVPFAIHPAEKGWLSHLPSQAGMFGLPDRDVPEVDRDLVPGETFAVGNLRAEILFTPGHTAGGCCLYFAEQKVVFVGDTLFAGSIGRTDLPGGSLPAILESIRDRLLVLPDEVMAYSGHGPATTIGAERRSNPFLQPGAFLDA
jgi:glyoxylase-like metal-dependent hydrolase (beta-lactamase superfamily II)